MSLFGDYGQMMVVPDGGGTHSILVPTPILLIGRQTSDYTGSPVQWNTESLGAGGANSDPYGMIATPSTDIVIPSALNGSLLRFSAMLQTANDDGAIALQSGGATLNGLPRSQSYTGTKFSIEWAIIRSAALAMATGQTITLASQFGSGLSNGTAQIGSWLAAEKIDPNTKRVKRSKTATQSLSAGSYTNIAWEQEDENVGGWTYSSGTFTVPAGTTGLIRLTACARTTLSAATRNLFVLKVLKNGFATYGVPEQHQWILGSHALSIASGIIPVVAGDTLIVQIMATSADTLESGGLTYVAIEEVSASIKRCMVKKASGQTMTSSYTQYAVAWDGSDEFDTDSIHDPSTNNTRLVAPAGTTWGRLTYNIDVSLNIAGNNAVFIQGAVNGTGGGFGLPQITGASNPSAASGTVNAAGAWIPMSPGDYFEVLAECSAAGKSINANAGTWALAEFI